jgi:hypothetical protein
VIIKIKEKYILTAADIVMAHGLVDIGFAIAVNHGDGFTEFEAIWIMTHERVLSMIK